MSRLLIFAILVMLTAAGGVVFEPGSWYAGLTKPPWTPPGWLFGPVWTVLYIAIAVAGWLTWEKVRSFWAVPMMAWAAQLVLNGLWSWLFFGLHMTGLALLDLAGMLVAIAAFIVSVREQSLWAARLFYPYALWVLYAGTLNFEIWRLN